MFKAFGFSSSTKNKVNVGVLTVVIILEVQSLLSLSDIVRIMSAAISPFCPPFKLIFLQRNWAVYFLKFLLNFNVD